MTNLTPDWQFLGDGWAATKTSDEVVDKALSLVTSDYQRDLIEGRQAWSGSTLKGKARHWGGRYNHTRRMLETRMRKADIKFSFHTVNRRKVLFLGEVQG